MVCLTLWDYTRDELSLLDTTRSRLTLETRYRSPTSIFSPSDYSLFFQPRRTTPESYDLLLVRESEAQPILIESGIYQPNISSNPGWMGFRARWSPDERSIAYLWQDRERNHHLTLFDVGDQSKRSAALPTLPTGVSDLWIGEWSADRTHLALLLRTNYLTTSDHLLWSVDTMQPVPVDENAPKLIDGQWSSQGHRFAALTDPTNGEQALLLIDPSNPTNAIRIPIDTHLFARNIVWSPSDAYVTLATQINRPDEVRGNVRQWIFDIYRADGTAVERSILGKTTPVSSQTVSSSGLTIIQPNIVTGFWSLEDEMWLYLQDEDAVTMNLIGFSPATGQTEVIEPDLVAELHQHMFQVRSRFYFYSESVGILPTNTELLLPIWQDDRITLELVDYTQGTRRTLLDNVDEIPATAFSFGAPGAFRWNDDTFVIPWTDNDAGEASTHLTIVSSSENSTDMSVEGIDDVEQIAGINADWIGFVTLRAGERHLEVIHLETSRHYRLLDGLSERDRWFARFSGDETRVAVHITDNNSGTSSGNGSLFLVSLHDGHVQPIEDEAFAYGIWSPDGDAFAFFRRGGSTRRALEVVNPSGETLFSYDMPRSVGASSTSLSRWNRCEAQVR